MDGPGPSNGTFAATISTVELFTLTAFPVYTNVIHVGLLVVMGAGLILNTSVIVCMLRYLRPLSTQNALVFGMCLNNIFSCLWIFPFLFRRPFADPGPVCRYKAYLIYLSQSFAVILLMLISLHRYFVLVHPTSTRLTMKGSWRVVGIMITCLLLIAALLVPPLTGAWGELGFVKETAGCGLIGYEQSGDKRVISYNIMGHVMVVFVPMVPMVFCYTRILVVMRRHNQKFSSKVQPGGMPNQVKPESKSRRMRDIRLTIVSVVMVTVFVTSYSPLMLVHVVDAVRYDVIIRATSLLLACVHAITDPVIYALGDNVIRHHLAAMLRCGY